jgi:hypothetical protein
MLTRTKVLNLYKEILSRSKYLPQNQVNDAISQTRKLFRDNRNMELSPALLKQAEDRLAFLKMVTPRTRSDMNRESRNSERKFKETFVIKNGEVITGQGTRDTQGFRDKRDDTEAFMKRHQQLLRRQHFMDRH